MQFTDLHCDQAAPDNGELNKKDGLIIHHNKTALVLNEEANNNQFQMMNSVNSNIGNQSSVNVYNMYPKSSCAVKSKMMKIRSMGLKPEDYSFKYQPHFENSDEQNSRLEEARQVVAKFSPHRRYSK